MKLRCSDHTIRQSHACESLPFPPAASAVKLAKARKLANRLTSRERLDVGNGSQDVEKHSHGTLTEGVPLAGRFVRWRASWRVSPGSRILEV